jgi:hypothetical protein
LVQRELFADPHDEKQDCVSMDHHRWIRNFSVKKVDPDHEHVFSQARPFQSSLRSDFSKKTYCECRHSLKRSQMLSTWIIAKVGSRTVEKGKKLSFVFYTLHSMFDVKTFFLFIKLLV